MIENNSRRIRLLEELARLVYTEWFVRFRYPGHEKVPHVDSELGPIPKGWEVRHLGTMVDTQYGVTTSTVSEETSLQFVRGTDMNKTSYIDWASVPHCDLSEKKRRKYVLRVGDILLVRMADPGKPAIIEKAVQAVYGSYIIRIRPKKGERPTPFYLFYYFLSDEYQGYITGASTGTTRKSASAAVLMGTKIVMPPDDILRAFENHVWSIRALLNNLLVQNANLRETRDLLLPRLVSGDVDVSDVDIAVPEVGAS